MKAASFRSGKEFFESCLQGIAAVAGDGCCMLVLGVEGTLVLSLLLRPITNACRIGNAVFYCLAAGHLQTVIPLQHTFTMPNGPIQRD